MAEAYFFDYPTTIWLAQI